MEKVFIKKGKGTDYCAMEQRTGVRLQATLS